MLKLLFHIGREQYVTECKYVIEVIPRVALSPIAHAPHFVAGILNYRGNLVPIVDFCYLIAKTYAKKRLSSRIVLVGDPAQNIQTFGFVAEKVSNTINQENSDFVDYRVYIEGLPFISKISEDPKGILYELNIPNLYSFLSDVIRITPQK